MITQIFLIWTALFCAGAAAGELPASTQTVPVALETSSTPLCEKDLEWELISSAAFKLPPDREMQAGNIYVPGSGGIVSKASFFADSVQNSVSRRFLLLATGADKFVSREKNANPPDNSNIQATLRMNMTDGAVSFSPDFGVQLAFPRTMNRFNLVIDHINEQALQGTGVQETITDAQSRLARGETETGTSYGLRYVFSITRALEQHIDAGLHTNLNLNEPLKSLTPFVKTSFAYEHPAGKWDNRIVGQIAWNAHDRLDLVGGLYNNRKIGCNLGLSFAGNSFWATDNANVEFYETLSLPWAVSPRDTITPSAQTSVALLPMLKADTYTVSLTYRRRIYRDWIFGDITTAADFPRAKSFHLTPRLTVSLQIYFGANP